MAGVAHLRPAAFAPILCPTAIHSCSHCGREETCSCLLVAHEGEGRREEGGRREGEKRREEGGGEREKEGGRRKGERKEGGGKRVKEGEEGRVRNMILLMMDNGAYSLTSQVKRLPPFSFASSLVTHHVS